MLHEIDLSRIDLNLLVLFEAVFAEQHVGRAAQRLSLSPSAVSHGIARLRTQLNDPLFLKTPRGVAPSERARALHEPIADVLARVRSVMATAEPFDPATTHRRFVIASPDGSAIVPLPSLLADLAEHAPGIDIGTRQMMPDVHLARPWEPVMRALDARQVDLAAITFGDVPQRFWSAPVYEDAFVVASRAGHAFAKAPTLEAYCAARHIVVSTTADPGSYTGDLLAGMGLTRRVQLTVPHFVVALSVVAETDLLVMVPRRLLQAYGKRLGLVGTPPPFKGGDNSTVTLVAPRVAMADEGLAWLVSRIRAIARRELGEVAA